ncbi:MAG: metal-dependent hydrolase [Myxococcota bacterium]
MASLGHVAVGMMAARLRHTDGNTRALLQSMVGWSALSLAPDLDVIAFKLGIPYAAPFGHRGASHAFLTAVLVGPLVALLLRTSGARFWNTTLTASAVLASHGLLDMLTDGGLGVAWWWPFSSERHFLPVRPIPVAPMGRSFLSSRGMMVAATELVMFAPLFLYALWPRKKALRAA